MNIKYFNEKYKCLKNSSEIYLKKEEELRYLVYGYYNSLDIIISRDKIRKLISAEVYDLKILEEFINEIVEYYFLLVSSTTNLENAQEINKSVYADDYRVIKCLILCAFHYLATECNYDDYIFRSLLILLESFMGKTYSNEDDKSITTCTFYYMYDDIKDNKFPEIIKESYEYLFFQDNYSYRYYEQIATNLLSAINFYIYENNLSIVSDNVLVSTSVDLIDEIKLRLNEIQRYKNPKLFKKINTRINFRRR